MKYVVLVILYSTLLYGCDQPQSNEASDAAPQESNLPPGFTDEAPPGPTSNTTVLSGGILYASGATPDSVIVVTDGNLVAWGTRGKVEMPNDSIGVDMRGKWIAPGVQGKDGALTLLPLPAPGDPASFLVFSDEPQEQPDTEGLIGWFAEGELVLQEDSEE